MEYKMLTGYAIGKDVAYGDGEARSPVVYTGLKGRGW